MIFIALNSISNFVLYFTTNINFSVLYDFSFIIPYNHNNILRVLYIENFTI